MRKLSEFIRRHSASRKSFDFLDHVSDIREYYNDDVPSHILEKIDNDEWYHDYIWENLKSHDYKKLQQKIKELYEDKIDYFDTYYVGHNKEKQSFFIVVKSREDVKRIVEDDEFLQLIQFYNYAISREHDKENKDNDFYIFLEPIHVEKIQDFRSKYHCQAYHFCQTSHVDSILKNGLGIKNSKHDKFPKRMYLYLTTKKLDCTSAEVKDFVSDVVNDYEDGWSCLKIDLWNTNIDIYKDDAMDSPEACFCVNNIPAKFISKYFES